MKRLYEHIVHHPKTILTIFSILFIVCLGCKQWIQVNYDMNDYLPSDSASTTALHVMEEEYDGGIPNARVMLNKISIPEVLQYKEKIKKIEGVSDVTWLDDVANITEPLETIDTDVVESYYKNGNALLSITIDEDNRQQAVEDIENIIGHDNALIGSAVSTARATTSTVDEVSKIAIIAVVFVFLVLIVTTTSWVEPIIILIGLGIAVVINAGSNIMFHEISFVTNAAGNILQLAVSLDYSVFLIHRFEECRREEHDNKKAMVNALCLSTSSILSSGLTTVIGFLALCLMKFQIGPDLGLALGKGIGISLISVFVFMPALILTTYKWIEKTHHRSFMPSFHKFGKMVTRVMIPMVYVFLLTVIPSFLASNANDFYYGASHIFNSETKLGADTERIESVFGKRDTYVLLVPKENIATQLELSNALKKVPEITNVLSYVDTVGAEIPEQYLDDITLSKLNSENYTRMVLSVNADYEGNETFSLVEKIRTIANDYYPQNWLLAGEGVSTYDLMNTVTADMIKVNLVAIVAVFIVLIITMKSISLPLILVVGIETAIWINLAIPYFQGSVLFYMAYLIISSIQLGATVDYAILFTDRYKESREKFNKKDAVLHTISAVTTSILTSGSALTVVGFLLGYISTHGLLSQLGILLGRGTICSLVIVFFVLPGLLYIFDRQIMKKGKKQKDSTYDGGNKMKKTRNKKIQPMTEEIK